MDEEKYLELQYEQGCSIVKTFIDTRYKILQFIGIYNGAILTIGFGNNLLFQDSKSLIEPIICFLSIFVMLMGIATENSNWKYFVAYFQILREIETKLDDNYLDKKIGLFSYGWKYAKKSFLYRAFPVNKAHKFFYAIFLLFWIIAFIYSIVK